MKRIPNNILPEFEKKTGIRAKFISAYLSNVDPVRPGRKRCVLLADASRELGYDFSASDWMFNPEKIKADLISVDSNSNPSKEQTPAKEVEVY